MGSSFSYGLESHINTLLHNLNLSLFLRPANGRPNLAPLKTGLFHDLRHTHILFAGLDNPPHKSIQVFLFLGNHGDLNGNPG